MKTRAWIPPVIVLVAATMLVTLLPSTAAEAAPPTIRTPQGLFIIKSPGLSIKDAILTMAASSPEYKEDAQKAVAGWRRSNKPLRISNKGGEPTQTMSTSDQDSLLKQLASPVVDTPVAAEKAGIEVSDTPETKPSAVNRLGENDEDASDPADFPVKGSSLGTAWSNMNLKHEGTYCPLLSPICKDETTDMLSTQVNINTGVDNLQLTFKGIYQPKFVGYDEDHFEVFTRFNGDDGTDVAFSNPNTTQADTGGKVLEQTFNYGNPNNIAGGQRVFFAVKLWVYTLYRRWISKGARTSESNCGGTTQAPTNNCLFYS